MKIKAALLTGTLMMLLAGCAPQATSSPIVSTPPAAQTTAERVIIPFVGGSETPAPVFTPTPALVSPLPRAEFTLADAIEVARADLATRLGIAPEDIIVKSAVREEMPVQDVECSKPSEEVTIPAFVMGYEVVLEAQGKTYVYRGRGWRMKLCDQGKGGSPKPEVPVILDKVVADLARTLGIEPEEVKVISVEEVTWPDTSLGCPEPGKVYAQVLTPGYRIVLKAREALYEYHTDTRSRFVRCRPK